MFIFIRYNHQLINTISCDSQLLDAIAVSLATSPTSPDKSRTAAYQSVLLLASTLKY